MEICNNTLFRHSYLSYFRHQARQKARNTSLLVLDTTATANRYHLNHVTTLNLSPQIRLREKQVV